MTQDPPDLKGDLFVNVETWLHEQELGASPFRGDGGHGGMDLEAARLIARRSHDPALSRATNGHRLTSQVGIIALLDRRIERIHVDMNDLPKLFMSPAPSAETSCPGFMLATRSVNSAPTEGATSDTSLQPLHNRRRLRDPASRLEPIPKKACVARTRAAGARFPAPVEGLACVPSRRSRYCPSRVAFTPAAARRRSHAGSAGRMGRSLLIRRRQRRSSPPSRRQSSSNPFIPGGINCHLPLLSGTARSITT